ncbi:hypothetical protein AB4144_55810 [Rhizobiaceae sp. 2RAB30]
MTILGGALKPKGAVRMFPESNTADAAITFALDNLEPFEVSEFLRDWREGKDLTPWLNAWEQDQQTAQEITGRA